MALPVPGPGRVRARGADEIVVVTGLPRSGTSLVMQMLGAGGLPLLIDERRRPDADNPRGLWRIATLESYQAGAPEWRTLIDVDQLGEDEGESWVWHGANCLAPEYTRCLVSLSPGGSWRGRSAARRMRVAMPTSEAPTSTR